MDRKSSNKNADGNQDLRHVHVAGSSRGFN